MGFERPGESISLDPEYVKLQRESEVKKYSDKIISLKDEIKALEARLNDVGKEIKIAHACHLDRIAAQDKENDNLRLTLIEAGKYLYDEQEAFKAEKEATTSSNKEFQAHIEAETNRNRVVLSQIEGERTRQNELSKKVDDYGSRIVDKEYALKATQSDIDEKLADISKKTGELNALKISTDPLLYDLQMQQQILSLSIDANSSKITELNSLRTLANKEKQEAKEANDILMVTREQNVQAVDALQELNTDLKIRERLLVENKNKFLVWERSSKEDISKKQNDLNEREVRIKNLESIQAGGK